MNGNDDLGIIAGSIPVNGQTTIATAGAEGGTNVVFTGTTGPVAAQNQNCQPPPVAAAVILGGGQIDSIFGNLTEATAVSQLIEPEEGNPADLTESEINDIRQTYLSLSLGMADFITADQIENAKNTVGVEDAIQDFLTARSLAGDGLYEESMEAYETAYTRAYEANIEGVKSRNQLHYHFK